MNEIGEIQIVPTEAALLYSLTRKSEEMKNNKGLQDSISAVSHHSLSTMARRGNRAACRTRSEIFSQGTVICAILCFVFHWMQLEDSFTMKPELLPKTSTIDNRSMKLMIYPELLTLLLKIHCNHVKFVEIILFSF